MNGKRAGRTLALALLLCALAAGAFLIGRATAPAETPSGYRAGYVAGREDAFGDYDGGWGYGEPYIVVLRRASPQITYAFAERQPMEPGIEYRICGKRVCSRRVR